MSSVSSSDLTVVFIMEMTLVTMVTGLGGVGLLAAPACQTICRAGAAASTAPSCGAGVVP